MTEVLVSQRDLDRWLEAHRAHPVRLVPTQGCLHQGHASLIEHAAVLGGVVVVTDFVNPLQFRAGPYFAYPRALDEDIAVATHAGADAVFAPEIGTMYPGVETPDELLDLAAADHAEPDRESFRSDITIGSGAVPYIRVPARLSMKMDGAAHPWHFDGVATVVARLHQMIGPDSACYGEKDLQQLTIIRELERWRSGSVRIEPVPILRDEHGVSLSSRLTMLTAKERDSATRVAQVLHSVLNPEGEAKPTSERVLEAAREQIGEIDGVELDALELVDPQTLETPERVEREAVLYAAYFIRSIRIQECAHLRVDTPWI